jgi:5-methylcytosine-specific restriction endonuclease McrA
MPLTTLKPRLQQLPARLMNHTTSATRMRGDAWMKVRERVLKANPLCVHCKRAGWVTAATEVDHEVPLSKGGNNDDANLQGLCHDCHAAKTKTEQPDRG